jgi:DNA-binding MarR family transcriptional regulator
MEKNHSRNLRKIEKITGNLLKRLSDEDKRRLFHVTVTQRGKNEEEILEEKERERLILCFTIVNIFLAYCELKHSADVNGLISAQEWPYLSSGSNLNDTLPRAAALTK